MAGTAGLSLGAAPSPVTPRGFSLLAWFVPQGLDQPPSQLPLPQSHILPGISLTFRGCQNWKQLWGALEGNQRMAQSWDQLMCCAWDPHLDGNALLWEELPEAEGSSQQKCLAGTGLKVISIKKTHSKPSDLHVPMYFGWVLIKKQVSSSVCCTWKVIIRNR